MIFEQGFIHEKSFFSDEESEKISEILNKSHKFNTDQETDTIRPLYNHEEYWNIITNKKILEKVKNLLGTNEIYYLYNSKSVLQRSNKDLSWHRDNVCRICKKGEDWDKKEKYNIIRVAIYLSEQKDTDTGLQVIPGSHKKKIFICYILRLLRKKMKFLNFNRFFRNFFDSIVGKKLKVDKGDCIFFIASLYHAALKTKDTRKAIFLSYGTKNKHAKNYTNYYFHHVHGDNFAIDTNMIDKNKFYEHLKSSNIFYEIPKDKQEIKGASV